MVSGIGNFASRIGRYGEYGANFIFGTGSMEIAEEIKSAVSSGKASGRGVTRSVLQGLSDGVVKTNAKVAETGYFRHIGKTFASLPKEMGKGWKNADVAGKGAFKSFFSKVGGFLKPIGKTMPFIMNALILATAIPNIIERGKDEGVFAGVKEAGKFVAKMGLYSLGAALGAPFGFLGLLAGPVIAGIIGDKVLGKDYSVKKAEQQEKMQELNQQKTDLIKLTQDNKLTSLDVKV